jgi:[acyl-carrier-protein] S-malonyltransferase
MAAVFPITEEDAKKAINAVDIQLRNTNLVVDLANINSPKQVVFSGDAEAVSLACEIAKKTWGAKKVVPLQVSAPFHSRIVRPASQAVARFLSKTPTVQPWIPIISNYTANIVRRKFSINRAPILLTAFHLVSFCR